ncbi:MAG: tRNA lysidine(34) synthetase TilS [Epsilonproteobacteria bacterium]|nr:tRNA lysidine(34) synthetase TilS [Campylobacterota bacterium]
MLDLDIISFLQGQKNLLAFSAGVDSSALFFLLQEHHIPFDIAIVDYQLREQSKKEVLYAKELAEKYNKKCFIHTAQRINTNFEANARKIRYNFFEEIIKQHHYTTLLTAHHLGDKLEWFLMQFTKGAGTVELSGMQKVQKKEHYTLIRPLLDYTKEELLEYLHVNNITYFIDETNFSQQYTRNRFRHQFSEKLLKEYKDGIKRSFHYLEEDAQLLQKEVPFSTLGEMCYFSSSSSRADLLNIDKYLKQNGYLLSKNEKEVLKKRENTIVGRRYLIIFYYNWIIITPYENSSTPMDKKFKETCRKLHIEPKLRPFLYKYKEALERIKTLKPKA